jgi:hypothetical protein
VPVDGTLNDYVSKMEQEGFRNLRTEVGTAKLNGSLLVIRLQYYCYYIEANRFGFIKLL